jgi:hypothetical protein
VPYVPEWEPLADAVKRIVGPGVLEDQARLDLCRAIADAKISIRVTIHAPHKRQQTYLRDNVGVPKSLHPRNIDWIDSRPTTSWWIGPALGQHYFWDGGQERIELVEVATADVMACLGGTRVGGPKGAGGRGYKRVVVTSAFEQIGIERLERMHQKEREHAIIVHVQEKSALKVSDRFIRKLFKERRDAGVPKPS